MREWYMENDSRTYVNLDDDGIAYDTDNDAWVPLGSSEGSTPYWWRFYESGDYSSSEAKGTESRKAPSEQFLKIKAARERLEEIEKQIPELQKKGGGGEFCGMGLIVGVPLLIGLVMVAYNESGGNLSNVATIYYVWMFILGAVVLGSIIAMAYSISIESKLNSLREEERKLKKEFGKSLRSRR